MQEQHILFICTGNYYRSRTAEEMFNHLAGVEKIPWRADSRGLHEDMSQSGNIGAMSPDAIAYLLDHHISIPGRWRMPESLVKADLEQADYVICLDEEEHRPIFEARFPAWAGRVSYWDVPDLALAPATYALPRIREHILKLIEELNMTVGAGIRGW